MKHLDLFSGIGGFALAARRVGWDTIGFCEIDSYCQKVLAKNFPGVPIHDDVKTYRGTSGDADIVTFGFPCQDLSLAGKQGGIDADRSGLWSEGCRIVGEVRPSFAVVENVTALLSGDSGRWFQRVLGDLAEIGYDCEWHCIPASAVGAPHLRDRVWIIAYPQHPDTNSTGSYREEIDINGNTEQRHQQVRFARSMGEFLADANQPRLERRLRKIMRERTGERTPGQGGSERNGFWSVEPDVGRVANGVRKRVDRLRGLGNAIVPACAQIIFEAINETNPRN